MDTNQHIFIPVILGTSRHGRMSKHVAKFVVEAVAKREGLRQNSLIFAKFQFRQKTQVNLSKTLNFLQP